MGDNIRGTRVYVGNLTDKVKKEDLESEFTKYGKLNSVWVAFNPPGFAFVEFENRDEAERACDILNGTEILGSKLRVEISKGRPKQGRGVQNRRFRGGGGGGRGAGGSFRNSRQGFRSGSSGAGGGGFNGPRNNSVGGGFRPRGGRGGRGFEQSNGFNDGNGGGGGGIGRLGGFGNRDGNFEGGVREGGGGRYGPRAAGEGPGGRFRSRSPVSARGHF